MSKNFFKNIAPGTITLGPINFDLFSSNSKGGMVLFCRSGYEINERHIEVLDTRENLYFIKESDHDSYISYTFTNLRKIVNNPDIRIKDKSEILYQIGKHSIKTLLSEPDNREVFKRSEKVIDYYVDFIISSPDAAASMFALSALDAYSVCTKF